MKVQYGSCAIAWNEATAAKDWLNAITSISSDYRGYKKKITSKVWIHDKILIWTKFYSDNDTVLQKIQRNANHIYSYFSGEKVADSNRYR